MKPVSGPASAPRAGTDWLKAPSAPCPAIYQKD